MNTALDSDEFGQLRARIEAASSGPTVVVITSATTGDGKTTTALGLARSLAEADTRVLFLDANVTDPTLGRSCLAPTTCTQLEMSEIAHFAKPLPERKFSGLSFGDKRFEAAMSMEKARAAARSLRSMFDFVVVDTAPLIRSDLAVLLAAVADSTIITVRLGRFPTTADGEMKDALARIDAKVMGVLTVKQALMKSFATERSLLTDQSARLAGRAVPSRRPADIDSVKGIVEPTPSNAI